MGSKNSWADVHLGETSLNPAKPPRGLRGVGVVFTLCDTFISDLTNYFFLNENHLLRNKLQAFEEQTLSQD